MMDMREKVKKLTEENMPEVVQWRRHLHRCPELSFEEFDTADFIAES